MNSNLVQPALVGGLVIGVLSALPIVNAGNICCCLWIVSGGLVAAYLLQQKQAAPITQGDGALVGLLAGLAGAFVSLIVSIPINMLFEPMQRQIVGRILENWSDMPPQFRQMFEQFARGDVRVTFVAHVLRLMFGFVVMICLGAVFSTLGGLLGAVFFRKPQPPAPPGTIDVSPGA